jgi:hypothetical protein
LHVRGIVEDDLIDETVAESEIEVRKRVDWHQYAFPLLVDPARDWMDTIGNRWGRRDINGWIRENEPRCKIIHHKAILEDGTALWPERFSIEKLGEIRATLGPYKFACFGRGTKILMADWTEKPIEEVRVGDMVVGFTINGTTSNRNTLIPTRVMATHSKRAKTHDMHLESGAVIRCTPDHKFYVGRSGRLPYAAARHGKRPSVLLRVAQDKLPYPRDPKLWGYLSGLIDGEGCVKGRNTLTIGISQSESQNPAVCRGIEGVLGKLGVPFSVYTRKQPEKPGKVDLLYTLRGGRTFLLALLKYGCCAKRDQLLKILWDHPKRPFRGGEDRVTALIPAREDELVFNMQTEAGNYIADRIGVSNCQYMNDPKDAELAAFSSKWQRFYQLLPDGDLVLDDGEVVKRSELFVYMVVDPAASPGNRNDRTAIVVTGLDPMGRIFILDAVAVRKDPYESMLDIHSVFEKWKPPQVGFETIGFQKLFIRPLERMSKEKGYWMPIVEIKGAQTPGAKETRINQVIGETFASGRAFLRKEMADFLDEYSWFPDPTTTRDLLDAYSLSDQLWVFRSIPKKDKKKGDEAGWWAEMARKAGRSARTGY